MNNEPRAVIAYLVPREARDLPYYREISTKSLDCLHLKKAVVHPNTWQILWLELTYDQRIHPGCAVIKLDERMVLTMPAGGRELSIFAASGVGENEVHFE